MIKKTCIIMALCFLSLIEVQSHGESKSKMDESDFKLKQLIEKSDAIITGRAQRKYTDAMGRHYFIKDAVVLKGCVDGKTPFIVVPFGRSSTILASGFNAFGRFDKSLYLFFLKKWGEDDKWYEEEKRVGSPYRINGVTYGPYGVIPLEKNAQLVDRRVELASLQSKDQVDEDFIRKVVGEHLDMSNVKRFMKDYRQRYEELTDMDTETFHRKKRATKKVNESLKAIKKLYGIDVPEEKDTFIAALKLLIDKKEPDEETSKDVREVVEKLKSVNWSEPEEKRSRPPFDEKEEDNGEEDLGIIFDSE